MEINSLLACLADASYDEETTRITHFARSLLKILTMSPEPVVKLASKAIAYLILVSHLPSFNLILPIKFF